MPVNDGRRVEAKALVFSFSVAGRTYGTPAFLRDRWMGFLEPGHHLPEVMCDEEEMAEF